MTQLEDPVRAPERDEPGPPDGPSQSAPKRVRPVLWWAAIGSGFLLLQLYLYAAWIFTDAHRLSTGHDPVPASTKVWAWSLQAASVIGLIVVASYCIRRSRREGRLTFDALVSIGFLTVWWQDTIVNYVRPNFFYNSYLVSFGAWDPHIPGWLSPSGSHYAEPPLLTGVLYGWWFVLFAVVFCMVAKRVHRRWPSMGGVGLFLIGSVVLGFLDFALESLAMHANLWAYSSVVPWLSLFAGKRYQWPLYEPFLVVGPFCSVIGIMRYRLTSGITRVPAFERGLDRIRASARRITTLRVLAFVGLANVMFVTFNVGWIWSSFYGNKTPSYPTYFRNGVCGPATPYTCPGPHVPIVLTR